VASCTRSPSFDAALFILFRKDDMTTTSRIGGGRTSGSSDQPRDDDDDEEERRSRAQESEGRTDGERGATSTPTEAGARVDCAWSGSLVDASWVCALELEAGTREHCDATTAGVPVEWCSIASEGEEIWTQNNDNMCKIKVSLRRAILCRSCA
jgi:hypothetical protein